MQVCSQSAINLVSRTQVYLNKLLRQAQRIVHKMDISRYLNQKVYYFQYSVQIINREHLRTFMDIYGYLGTFMDICEYFRTFTYIYEY